MRRANAHTQLRVKLNGVMSGACRATMQVQKKYRHTHTHTRVDEICDANAGRCEAVNKNQIFGKVLLLDAARNVCPNVVGSSSLCFLRVCLVCFCDCVLFIYMHGAIPLH